jgi:hypothetical protein
VRYTGIDLLVVNVKLMTYSKAQIKEGQILLAVPFLTEATQNLSQ